MELYYTKQIQKVSQGKIIQKTKNIQNKGI